MPYNQDDKPDYIDFFIDYLDPDPTPYKRFSPHFRPVTALVLRLPVDSDHILVFDGNYDISGEAGTVQDGVTVIGIDGLKLICRRLTTALEDAHEEQRDEQAYLMKTGRK